MNKFVFFLFLFCCLCLLFSCDKKSGSDENKSSGKHAASKYTVSIDITQSPVSLYYGETHELKASVRDRNGVSVDDALINWSVDSSTESRAGIFSVLQTSSSVSTVFTAGQAYHKGKITAEYQGVTDSVDIEIKAMTYTVTIDFPSSQPTFIYKGKTQQFKASVKNARNVSVTDAQISWRTSGSNIGSLSTQKTFPGENVVFTAGHNNYKGKIYAEYGGALASVDVTIGEIDEIKVTGTGIFAIIDGAETVKLTAVVKANGYTLKPQPEVNWESSKETIGFLSPASGETVSFVPKSAGIITATAKLASDSAIKGTAQITVKSKYTINLQESLSVRYHGDVTAERSGSDIKVSLQNPRDRVIFRFHEGAAKDLQGYTKMRVTLRCSNGGINYAYLGMYDGHRGLLTYLSIANTVYEFSIKNIDLSNVNEFLQIENPSVGAETKAKTIYVNKIELL